MSKVIAAQSAFPDLVYSQKEISSLLKNIWPKHTQVIERLETTSGVETRHLARPLEWYLKNASFGERNQIYLESSLELLKKALTKLHLTENFKWEDVGAIYSTTITGVAVPSVEARLMNHFTDLSHNLVRVPLFGLGCLGGIGALNRASDWLRLHPDRLVIVLAVEICSTTFQLQDVTMANLVATHLFGDGGAAVLLAGDNHPLATRRGLRILSHSASFYPDTEKVMGWEMIDQGFQIILSGNVPQIVRKNVAEDIKKFLSSPGATLDDLKFLISHPGGPKVLTALEEVTGKGRGMAAHSWNSLRENGNMSSVSVLDVLGRTLEEKENLSGLGLGLAMGPAFNSELTLFKGC